MFDRVTITYRGAKYEIGRGSGFYGVWTAGGPRSQPLERWPETPEGWTAAWTRFASIEAPGTIVPVGRNTPPVARAAPREGEEPGPFGESAAPAGEPGEPRCPRPGCPYARGQYTPASPVLSGKAARIVAAALLGAGVILGVAGLFPAVPRRLQPRPAGRPGHPARHLPGRLDRERRAHPARRRPPAARRAAQPGAERGHVRPVLRGRRHGHLRGGERRRRRGPRALPHRLARLRGGIGGRVPGPPGQRSGPAAQPAPSARWRGRADPRSVPSCCWCWPASGWPPRSPRRGTASRCARPPGRRSR